jgi:hypothetical protein
MIRHHTLQSKWTDEGNRAVVSLPCEPWEKPTHALRGTYRDRLSYAPNWTDDEIKTLVDLRRQGLTLKEIAEKLGRTRSSIEGKLRRLT